MTDPLFKPAMRFNPIDFGVVVVENAVPEPRAAPAVPQPKAGEGNG